MYMPPLGVGTDTIDQTPSHEPNRIPSDSPRGWTEAPPFRVPIGRWTKTDLLARLLNRRKSRKVHDIDRQIQTTDLLEHENNYLVLLYEYG